MSPTISLQNRFINPVFETNNLFVTKVAGGGTSLEYSTYIGGQGAEQGFAIAVNGAGNARIANHLRVNRLLKQLILVFVAFGASLAADITGCRCKDTRGRSHKQRRR